MSIKKMLFLASIAFSIFASLALAGCNGDDNPGGGGAGGNTGNNTYDPAPVKIGDLTWTSKNLNIATPQSWCYEDSASYCEKYGRLYTWEAAKAACASLSGGWRLPDNDDWDYLVDYAGTWLIAGKGLKSKRGWDEYMTMSGNGTDDYGFSALPGGFRHPDGGFWTAGATGTWWSATEDGGSESGIAYALNMGHSNGRTAKGNGYKSYGYSVRCVMGDKQ